MRYGKYYNSLKTKVDMNYDFPYIGLYKLKLNSSNVMYFLLHYHSSEEEGKPFTN